MKIILMQFIILTLMAFSFDSCLKNNRNSPTEKSGNSNFKPQYSPTPVEVVDSQPISPLADNWQISLESSGGYTNAGTGNITADATGKFTYQKPRVMGKLPPPCEIKLSQQETKNLRTFAVKWRVPDEGGKKQLKLSTVDDDTHFKMKIGSGNANYELEFHGSTFDMLPLPNQNLINALFDLGKKECGENGGK